MLSPREALTVGADLIEQYGHRKHEYGDTDTGFCAAGAIGYAITGRPRTLGDYFFGDIDALNVYLEAIDLLPFGRGGIAAWNDSPRTTADEVMRTLRECAA